MNGLQRMARITGAILVTATLAGGAMVLAPCRPQRPH